MQDKNNDYMARFFSCLAEAYIWIGSIAEKYSMPANENIGLTASCEPSLLEEIANPITLPMSMAGEKKYIFMTALGVGGSGLNS